MLSNGKGPWGSEQGAEESSDTRLPLFEVGLTDDSGRESLMVTVASVLLISHSFTLK
jgi:hypothetical protein